MSTPATGDAELGRRIEHLDTSLFDLVPAQLEPDDRRSLLALHAACRQVHRVFSYLEIGSHLGGSLQALIRDPACAGIVSIDSRPAWQPDERGVEFAYPDNSTARMLELLRAVPESSLEKVHTFDANTTELRPDELPLVPQLSLIDGEHTDEAAVRDARFCRAASRNAGCLVFHDAAIVYGGISQFLNELREEGADFTAYVLPSTVFVVELGEPLLRDVEQVTSAILGNYRGYLFSLQANEPYRAFFNRPRFRAARRLRALIRPNSVFR